jgi:hypothetical protein
MKQTGFRIDNEDNYLKFCLFLKQEGKSTQSVFNDLVNKIARQYDGMINGLDRFVDSSFVPTPHIDAGYDKVIEYMKTLSEDEKLETLRDEFYRYHTLSKALLAQKPDERRNFEMNYPALWKIYG